jgi:ubiquitin-conjugating enzyme E2 H
MMADHDLALVDDSLRTLHVLFKGPRDSPYEGGVWRVRVELPDSYPHKSPSVGFANHIFHPNVCPLGGAVCLDVLNQTWSAMYDLVNVFDVFLPQLLLYPNPEDPLNDDAARMMRAEPARYAEKVRELVRAHASPERVTLEGDVSAGDVSAERAERASIEDATSHPASGTATATAADDEDDDLGADAYVSSGDEDGAA